MGTANQPVLLAYGVETVELMVLGGVVPGNGRVLFRDRLVVEI